MDILSNGIYGQEKPIQILNKLYSSNKLPNAILLNGKDGVGKHQLALNYLKLLNSSNNSCDKIFKQIDYYREPFVKLVIPLPRGRGESSNDLPLAKLTPNQIEEITSQIKNKAENPYSSISIEDANVIKISSIRELSKFLSIAAEENIVRGIIISDAHLMTIESQNALLKNLEEPPKNVIFILITSQKDFLLETIRSRCWNIELSPLDQKSIRNVLINKYDVNESLADKVSFFSEGSISMAVELLKYDIDELLDKTITILRYSLAKRYFTAISNFNDFIETSGPKVFIHLVMFILKWFSDGMTLKYTGDVRYFIKHKNTLEKFNKSFPDYDVPETISAISNLSTLADKNINLNVIILNIIFKLSKT